MERKPNQIKCMFCKYVFEPELVMKKEGKGKNAKAKVYIECPRCGNGIERNVRSYNNYIRKVAQA